MSSGVEKRPKGMVAMNLARISGVSSPMNDLSSGVSPATGLIAFTRMPTGASSTAMVFVAVIIQPFDALYQFSRGRGETPAVDATLRIGHECACGQKDRLHVDVGDPVKVVFGYIFKVAGQMRDARVIHQNIKWSMR